MMTICTFHWSWDEKGFFMKIYWRSWFFLDWGMSSFTKGKECTNRGPRAKCTELLIVFLVCFFVGGGGGRDGYSV
jgi:hypothetical protein